MQALGSLPTWHSAHQRQSLCGQSTVTWSAAWRWWTACRRLWSTFTSMAAPTLTLLSQKTVGGQMCSYYYFVVLFSLLKKYYITAKLQSQKLTITIINTPSSWSKQHWSVLVSLLFLHSSSCIHQVLLLALSSLKAPSSLCSMAINEQWHFVVRMSAQPPCVTPT